MIKYIYGGDDMLYKMNLSGINLNILGRTNENPPWRHDGRVIDYNHLLFIVSGSCECSIENRIYNVKTGDIVFIPANKYYRLVTKDHCEYYFACFHQKYEKADKSDIDNCLRLLPEKDKKFYLPHIDSKQIILNEHNESNTVVYSNMLTLFCNCQTLYSSGSYLDRLQIDVYFMQMLIQTSKVSLKGCENKYPISLERMVKYINQHFTEHITPESLSEHFGLSKEHICSVFKKELSTTVSEYVNKIKLEHATELLSNSSMNVSQIAEYLGYSSVYYFSRIFKKYYGVPPTAYIVKL